MRQGWKTLLKYLKIFHNFWCPSAPTWPVGIYPGTVIINQPPQQGNIMVKFLLEDALLSQQWEKAKGELRALVALRGAYTCGTEEPYPFQLTEKAVDKFIKEIEHNGLHEMVQE